MWNIKMLSGVCYVFATLTTFAAAAEPGPFAEKQSIACEPPQVPVCWVDPSIPPNPLLPGNNTVCECQASPDPVRLTCEIRIRYPMGRPKAIAIGPVPAWCNNHDQRRATAAALQQLLE